MIFGFFRAINTAQNITTLLFLSVIFLSIGTSSFETKHHPLRSFRRKNSCYCPKNDFWRSKYSEDVKFSLMSHEYRTHLKVLLDGSIVVEEGSPELLHGDNIWFTSCEGLQKFELGSSFEVCLAGFKDKKLVFDTINGNFKVTMFPEQLTDEYHHMKMEASVYLEDIDDKGRKFIHLTIRPKTEDSRDRMYMLWIDRTRRVENDYDPWKFQMKEVGRVSMIRIPEHWDEVEHVKLEMLFK